MENLSVKTLPKPTRIGRGNSVHIEIKNNIITDFLDNKLSRVKISVKYNLDYFTVSAIIRNNPRITEHNNEIEQRDKTILDLYYKVRTCNISGQKLTMKNIAKKFNLNEQQVSYIIYKNL